MWLAAVLSVAALVPVWSQQQSSSDAIYFRLIIVDSQDAAARVREQLLGGGNFVRPSGMVRAARP